MVQKNQRGNPDYGITQRAVRVQQLPRPAGTSLKDKRYDLQYMIYSVAAHRYFSQRLGDKYEYDNGEYSFGGVFYLFLRGMGYSQDKPHHGIWSVRPKFEHIEGLSQAFLGKTSSESAGD